ncbi:hypothetical protein QX204_32315 [Nocardia sp. PE-7]|uniref:hypothetical protein n=1 Tax=Nocardia sp. PE-7 TaxID=3058426 RepID=UPI0026581F0F|nr:hypothetical protein [Nocardia sp. PE-7]WKG09626.1 hypothetical protein QX204_32315 [Nocardia sp. PE-7]
MNKIHRIASIIGAAAVVLGVGATFAGTASAINVPTPLHCGEQAFQEVHEGYIYRYELISQNGTTYYYGVSVPNVPAGWVPVGEVACTAGYPADYPHY